MGAGEEVGIHVGNRKSPTWVLGLHMTWERHEMSRLTMVYMPFLDKPSASFIIFFQPSHPVPIEYAGMRSR